MPICSGAAEGARVPCCPSWWQWALPPAAGSPTSRPDRAAFVAPMKTTHSWTIAVEHRGTQVDVDQLLYKWLRCELVHEASLPPDVRIDHHFDNPDGRAVRAGGAPSYAALLSPGWYRFLVDAVRHAPANRHLGLTSVPPAAK